MTLAAPAIARFGVAGFPGLLRLSPEIAALAASAVAASWFGAGLLGRLDARRHERLIAALLAGIGLLLLAEAAAGAAAGTLLPPAGVGAPDARRGKWISTPEGRRWS